MCTARTRSLTGIVALTKRVGLSESPIKLKISSTAYSADVCLYYQCGCPLTLGVTVNHRSFTADICTCHNMKSTCVINNTNKGSVPFSYPAEPCP